MTLLGKIFTVLIFVMSIVFFAFSLVVYATHKNWKIVATHAQPDAVYNDYGLKQKVEQERTLVKRLQDELAALKRTLEQERAARRQALAVLETKRTQLTDQLVSKEAEFTAAQAKGQEAIQELKSTQETLKALTDEVTTLRTKIRDTELDRDAQFTNVVTLTDKLLQLEGTAKTLLERQGQLRDQVVQYKKHTDVRGIKVEDPIDHVEPKVDGQVTAVGTKGLVEISIGADDGLRTNHQLDVFRDATYLGKITVLKTSPDRAVAQINKDTQRGPIQKGDKVGTKLISINN